MGTGKVLALLLVALAGCDRTYLDVYGCQNPDEDHKDATGEPDPCHRNDPPANDAGPAGDAGGTCDGQCVPGLPENWRGPALLWVGDEAAAPHCSEVAGAPLEVYTGYGDLDAPTTCGACACDAPIGSCALPATLTAAAASCAGDGPGVAHTSFDPPASWGGTCTASNAIPTGKLCGGVPCVQSVTIAPLTLTQGGCLPIEPANVQAPPVWKTFARACSPMTSTAGCGTEGGACAPRAPSSKFRICTHDRGKPSELPCPAAYPDRSIFYKDFVDGRTCEPCTCGAPEGSTCTASIGLFSDGACGAPLVVPIFSIDATGPACFDINPTGPALGSKSASEPTFTHGTCKASGGKPTGEASGDVATVFCCIGTP
jgi:hypothetical protein